MRVRLSACRRTIHKLHTCVFCPTDSPRNSAGERRIVRCEYLPWRRQLDGFFDRSIYEREREHATPQILRLNIALP